MTATMATVTAGSTGWPSWMPRRRRSGRLLLLATVLVVLGVLAGVFAYRAAVHRDGVVGVVRQVPEGSVVTAEDVREVRLPPDAGLAGVPWEQLGSVVGGFAAVDLLPGQVVTAASVTFDRVPGRGEAVVGLAVDPGRVPSGDLAPRDPVLIVIEAGAAAVRALVVRAGPPGVNGRRDVDVLVPEAVAARLATAAAANQVSVVLVGRP
ncbi:MAG: SAF domain-containing protein [Pseudonocardia sp.]|nr:SAF domain-containing protein [Pseudonocardia sp.]